MNKKSQFGPGMGIGNSGLLLGIILVAALIVGYSFIKTGTPLEGINMFIDYVMQDPVAAGVLFVAGIILGKVTFRTYV